jgi:CHAD domain-containing protein
VPAPRVGPYIADSLHRLDEALGETLPRLVAGSDAEALHDMRVAIRRQRSLLKVVRPVYGRFHADAVRRAFADVQRATGTLRDEEVLEETLAALELRDPVFEVWRARRKARERLLRRHVVTLAQGEGLAVARRMLEALVALPVHPKRNVELAAFARRTVERAERGIRHLPGVRLDDVDALHQLRIAFKNLRYALEAFLPALPPDAADRAKQAAQFQKRLGEIHDVDVALEVLGRSRSLPELSVRRASRALQSRRKESAGRYLLLAVEAGMMVPGRAPRGGLARGPIKPSAPSRSGRSRPS